MVITHPLMRKVYERKEFSRTKLAQAITNSTAPAAGLIPWCLDMRRWFQAR